MELVENLKQAGIITKQRVVDAMNKIDRYIDLKDLVVHRWLMFWYRGDYAPRGAYLDEPQSIGYGATISAPYVD